MASAKLQKADLELGNLKTLLAQKQSDLKSKKIPAYLLNCRVLKVASQVRKARSIIFFLPNTRTLRRLLKLLTPNSTSGKGALNSFTVFIFG